MSSSEGVCSEELCSEGVSSGRSSSMAESIISMCRRTWSQERRIGVLLRAFEPEATFTVWDCVPECIIDSHLKDAFEYHSDQRDYLLFYAVPASAILRSIRRLDGYRASPFVLKSLHFFDHHKEIDAYNFQPESDSTEDFSESEYDEDSFVSRESTLSPTQVSEFDDSDIHTTTQIYNSKSEDDAELKDELVRCKPQQWIEYPESEAFEICIAPVQPSASDVDDEASSREPQLLPYAHQPYTESDDDLKDDEPLGANSSEPQLLSPVHQSSQESDDDLKDDDEPRLISPVHSIYTEPDEDSKDDEPIEANSPKTQTFSPAHRSSPESDDSLKDDGPLEANNPDTLPLLPEVYPFYPVFDDGEEDMLLTGECPEPRQFSNEQEFYLEPEDGQKADDSFEAADADPRPAFRAQFRGVYSYHPVFFDSDDEEDELLTEESHEQKSFLQPDDSQKADESFEAYDADPRPAFRAQFRGVYPYHSVFFDTDDEEEVDEPLTSPSSEPRTPSPVRCQTHEPEFGEQEPHETRGPKPQRIVTVHQSLPRLYDPEPRLELDHEGLESLEIWNLY